MDFFKIFFNQDNSTYSFAMIIIYTVIIMMAFSLCVFISHKLNIYSHKIYEKAKSNLISPTLTMAATSATTATTSKTSKTAISAIIATATAATAAPTSILPPTSPLRSKAKITEKTTMTIRGRLYNE